jgi:hypothetical protein
VDYQERIVKYQLMLRKNIEMIENIINDNDDPSSFPFLQKWLTSYGKSNGNKLLSLHHFALEKSTNPLPINDSFYFFVSQRFMSAKYGGAIRTWNKCISLLAASGLISKHKASTWKQDRGLLTASQQTSLLKAKTKGHMPNIHYIIPCYTIDLLKKADKTLKQFFQDGGSVTGLSKSMLIDMYGQKEANRIEDDSRKKTKEQVQAEILLERFLTEQIQTMGMAIKDKVINTLALSLKCNLTRATRHYKRCWPSLKSKYQLIERRIGVRKQAQLGIISDKKFVFVITQEK